MAGVAATDRIELEIPRYFKPRSYQGEFVRAMRSNVKRAALVWHRRAGKDATVLNWTIEAMLRRVGVYYYFLPTYRQGKRILWDGIQADGRKFLDHFPSELISATHETEMKITFKNGSIFQIIGADNVDTSVIGTNPVGVVFSEFSLMDPTAWDMLRPVLAENNGWAVFVFTPRGRNWGYKLWQGAIASPLWFTSMWRADQTTRDSADEDGVSPVVTTEAIQAERDAGMAEELIQQEFYCSFEGAMMGSYYGDLLEKMRADSRITAVPYDPDVLVDTSWDLGVSDETVIGFWQDVSDRRTGRQWLALIDIEVDSGHGLDEYRKRLAARPYVYGRHFSPHDMKVREWGTGNTRLQTAWKLGLNFEVVPKLGIAEGINAVRRMFPHLLFDEETANRQFKGHTLIDALAGYRREYDEKLQTYRAEPVHDWTSHFADMVRYRAIMYAGRSGFGAVRRELPPERCNTTWSPFDSGDRFTPLTPFRGINDGR